MIYLLMTEILFYDNPDLMNFRATILSVDTSSENPAVVLDRTAFYPEGGGQPADRGTINGVNICDVRKKDGEIYHLLKEGTPREELVPGEEADCIIDSTHRFDYMQQHSGQHLISAAMMSVGGIETVSVHQGTEYTAVEVSAETIDHELIRRIEDEANGFIRSNTPIIPEWTDEEGLKTYNLRRPSKHSNNIRIVNIAGIDCVACGGMHLKTTSEVGLIKYTHQERIRGRIRTFWKIGGRAYDDYAEKTEIINSLNELYSARQFELVEKARAAIETVNELKYKNNRLEEENAEVQASILTAEAEPRTSEGKPGIIIKAFEDRSKAFIASLLKALSYRPEPGIAFIFNRNGDRLTWAVVASEETGFDFNTFKSDYLPLIDGKGGGRAPLWQGASGNPDGLEAFIDRVRSDWL